MIGKIDSDFVTSYCMAWLDYQNVNMEAYYYAFAILDLENCWLVILLCTENFKLWIKNNLFLFLVLKAHTEQIANIMSHSNYAVRGKKDSLKYPGHSPGGIHYLEV